MLTGSTGLQGFVADFKNTGLIGSAAVSQDSGLIVKSLAAARMLNSTVLKLVAHGIGVGERLLVPNGSPLQTFVVAHTALPKGSLKMASHLDGTVAPLPQAHTSLHESSTR